MIEAHLFRRIKVNRDVKLMRLCRHRKVTDTTPPLNGREWDTIQKNAAEWCLRNGVKYVVIG